MPLENGLDDRYITSSDLQQYFVNKSKGEANAYGSVRFWKDSDRDDPKLVYQLVQDSNTFEYSYVALSDPLYLSGVGTFIDGSGNDIAVYYYPYDEFGNLELYYVEVFDSNLLLQFTREAWPYPLIEGGGESPVQSSLGVVNQLSNPQFSQTLFAPNTSITLSVTGGGTTNFNIAPNWVLQALHSGSGDIIVEQLAVAGLSAYPYNPPYILKITGNNNLTGLNLRQKLNINPDWAAPQNSTSTAGYLAGTILLGPPDGAIPGTSVIMQYVPNAGTTQTILDETNNGASFAQFNATIQLAPAANPNAGSAGFDEIVINLSNFTSVSQIGNVQVLPLTSNVDGLPFEQSTSNRQLDQMFNYYKAGLDAKPVESYLIGWDFPLNPAQFLGSTVPASAIGVNKSKYVWDQTIIFQSANSGVGVTRNSSGAIVLTAAATTKMALIQYLPQATARSLLQNQLSCMVSAYASVGITATVSLWYTTDVSLPSTWVSNDSLVLTLDDDGKPATFNGTWAEVPRNLQDATFTIGTATASKFNQYPLTGWDLNNAAVANTATYFAIVVGTAEVASGESLTVNSISLVPGSVATIPAAKTLSQVLLSSQAYYWKTYPLDVVPGTIVPAQRTNAVVYRSRTAGLSQYIVALTLPTYMNSTPVLTFYSPVNSNGNWYNDTLGADSGVATVSYAGSTSVLNLQNPQALGDGANNTMLVHLTANAVLGY